MIVKRRIGVDGDVCRAPGYHAGVESPHDDKLRDGSVAEARAKDVSEARCGESNRLGAFDRTDWQILALIVGVALVIRAIYLLELRSCPFFSHETMDAEYHDGWARAIGAGKLFASGPYFRAPLYPWFLGMLYRLFGADYFVVRFVQVLIGSVSCGLVYVIGRPVFGRSVAAVAGLACSTYWILVYFDAELLIPPLAVFLDLLLVWSLLRVGSHRTVWRSVVAGLLLGLSALARPNILLFAPFAAAWVLCLKPRPKPGPVCVQRTGRLGPAIAFTLAVLVPIVPVTIRNYVVGKDFVLIASQGGLNFYIGNNARASGMRVRVPGIKLNSIRAIYQKTTQLAERETGRSLMPSEVSRHFFGKAVAFMRSNPADAASLMAHKTAYFWSHREILNNKHIYFLTDRYTPVVNWLVLGFWIVGPLGLMGLAACRGRGFELFPLWGFVVVYMVSVVLFFVTSRFRVPVLPVLMLLGVYGLTSLAAGIRARQWIRVAVLALTAGGGALLASQTPPSNIDRPEVVLVSLAKAELDQGNHRESIALFNEALAQKPLCVETHHALGLAYTKLGHSAEALAAFARTVEIAPKHVGALTSLGKLETELGRYDDAIGHLRRAVRINPKYASAQFNLGRTLSDAGQNREALRSFEAGLAIRPNHAPALVAVCLLRSTVDDPSMLDCEKARTAGERSVELAGGNAIWALDALAAAYAECGQFRLAALTAEKAIELARRRGKDHEAGVVEEHQALYRAGRPLRQE